MNKSIKGIINILFIPLLIHSAKSSNNCNNYSPINKDKNKLQNNSNIWSNVTLVLLGSIKMHKNYTPIIKQKVNYIKIFQNLKSFAIFSRINYSK